MKRNPISEFSNILRISVHLRPFAVFYQGLARQKLNQPQETATIFQRLIDYGNTHLNDSVQMDYFAVSLPNFLVFDEDLTTQNKVHCFYMHGLGQLELRNKSEAKNSFERVLELEPFHTEAILHKALLTAQSESAK